MQLLRTIDPCSFSDASELTKAALRATMSLFDPDLPALVRD